MQYEYPELLDDIQNMLEKKLGVKFTYVMCNWYEEGLHFLYRYHPDSTLILIVDLYQMLFLGSVYIGPHRDNKDNASVLNLFKRNEPPLGRLFCSVLD